jgi:hypothetical protein
MITISTESGDGRHNDVKRELSGIFHAITGANGRFKTGQILDVGPRGSTSTTRCSRRWAPPTASARRTARDDRSTPSAPDRRAVRVL